MPRRKEKDFKLKTFSLDVKTVERLEELRNKLNKPMSEIIDEAIEKMYKQEVSKNIVVIDLENNKELLSALRVFQGLYLKEFGEYIDFKDVILKFLHNFLLGEIMGVDREIIYETINFFRRSIGLNEISEEEV